MRNCVWKQGKYFVYVAAYTSLLYNFIQPKSEFMFCAGSNPAHGLSEIRDVEDL